MNKGNTPLEVMAAIVANGGPVLAWVKDEEHDEWSDYTVNITGVDLDGHGFCSLTNPNQQYKPIPTEWAYSHSKWRAVDHLGRLLEFMGKPVVDGPNSGWINVLIEDNGQFVSTGHDPTNWQNSLEQRPRKMRPMTSLEAFEFLAEGHEGKPRVWRGTGDSDNRWFSAASWEWDCLPEFALFANLSDRDGDTLTWREFPQIEEDKA